MKLQWTQIENGNREMWISRRVNQMSEIAEQWFLKSIR